ncbi:hypothetical protein Trydic_g12055 [Trypoxylus dichotomus]
MHLHACEYLHFYVRSMKVQEVTHGTTATRVKDRTIGDRTGHRTAAEDIGYAAHCREMVSDYLLWRPHGQESDPTCSPPFGWQVNDSTTYEHNHGAQQKVKDTLERYGAL